YIVFTNPLSWTPHSMYEAVCMFSSNLNSTLVEGFYRDFFVPHIRLNIKKFGKLNIYLYKALKKSIFKPAGFFKGIIFPMAENLTAKEANIIGSILKKCSIPIAHSASAIMKLLELNGFDRISNGHFLFVKLLLSKKYALPTPVKNGVVNYIAKLSEKYNFKNKQYPVIFHQLLLIFVQTYKFDFNDEERKVLLNMCSNIKHHMITPLVIREINYKK
ncbi:MAG: hypothetical protein ACK5YA_00175, partial [bacterium]